jgi:hypothetical protein
VAIDFGFSIGLLTGYKLQYYIKQAEVLIDYELLAKG